MRNVIKTAILILIFCIIITAVSLAKTGTIQNSDYLNLRENPTTISNLLVRMPGNAKFEILEDLDEWYKVKYENYTGYVNKQYVKVNDEVIVNTNIPPKTNAKGIINKNSNVYTLPLLNSIKLGEISANTELTVVSIAGNWAYIQSNDISGWIFKDNVNGTEDGNNDQDVTAQTEPNNEPQSNNNTTIQTAQSNNNQNNTNYPMTMYVNVDAVYIRQSTSTDSEKVTSIGLNTPVTVKGTDGEWYKVQTDDGSGYMLKQYLSSNKKE